MCYRWMHKIISNEMVKRLNNLCKKEIKHEMHSEHMCAYVRFIFREWWILMWHSIVVAMFLFIFHFFNIFSVRNRHFIGYMYENRVTGKQTNFIPISTNASIRHHMWNIPELTNEKDVYLWFWICINVYQTWFVPCSGSLFFFTLIFH